MDPDETLDLIRELVRGFVGAEDACNVLDQIEEKFDALDQWLCRGGFLPKEWQR